jgi:hypothetical protein
MLAHRLRAHERKVLLRSLRSTTDAEDRDALANDQETWERVFRAAAHLGVAPLLYMRLRTSALRSQVPPDVLQRHRGDFLWSQARNMKAFARLRDVLATFHANHIEVMGLKGAVLAEHIYRPIGIRTMGDVDLLVRRGDLPRVERILEELGFQADETYRTKDWYETQHHHIVPYATRDGVLKLDIHHDITTVRSRIRVPVEDLWKHAQVVSIASTPCLALSWEHMLLHLALHMADQNHFLGDLRGLCDVAEIARRVPRAIDWDDMVRVAEAWGATTQLFLTLSLSREAVGAAVPTEVLRKVRRHVPLPRHEETLLRFLCLRAALIFDTSQHPLYDWVLLDLVGDLLTRESRARVVRHVVLRAMRRVRGHFA